MADVKAVKVSFLLGIGKPGPGQGESTADVGAAKIDRTLKNGLPEKGIHCHFQAIEIDRSGELRLFEAEALFKRWRR